LQHVMKPQGYQNHCNPGFDLHLSSYTEGQFLEVAVKVLPKLKIAHIIGKTAFQAVLFVYMIEKIGCIRIGLGT
jgi:hypothetical protein